MSIAGEMIQIVRDEISRVKMEIDGIEMSGKPSLGIFSLTDQLDVLERVLSKMLLALENA